MKKGVELFGPSRRIRSFDGRDFIGKIATIEFEHISDDKKSQYVHVRNKDLSALDIWPSGWVKGVLGNPGDKIRRKIRDVALIAGSNGGRSSSRICHTYSQFFNAEAREEYENSLVLGMQYHFTYRGDPDRADVIVKFDEFEIDDHTYSIIAPEEWYSDFYKDDPKFRFVDGFYPNAEVAIEVFARKNHNDLFGERYFPVIVFPISKIKQARDIAGMAKNCSTPIITGGYWVIIGTRCKPSHYADVIKSTYSDGGKIPVGVEWDWQQ